jgi:predicted small metal-binding protein
LNQPRYARELQRLKFINDSEPDILGEFLPSFKCRDIGLDCPFEATAKTDDELMKKISAHAASVHNMKTVSPEMMAKIKKAIKK